MSYPPLVNDLRLLARGRSTGGDVCSKIIASLLLLGALWILTGCQGLSSGSSNPSQSGTISVTNPSLAFGSVKAGSSKTVSTTATNSGSAAVTINSVAISSKYFNLSSPSLPVTIASGQSVSLSVVFTPNAAGTFSGSISISSTAADSVTSLALSGTGTTTTETTPGQLALNPGSESFGNVTVGSSRSSTFTLTNSGGTSVDVSQVSVGGAGFQISGITAPLTLNASQSMTFSVAFAPQVTGSASGSVIIASNASDPTLTIPLSGTGTSTVTTPQLGVTPTTLGLGNVVVGTSGTASGTLSASGGSVTVTGATSNNSVFVIGGISLPVTIPSGQSVPFTVSFSPQVSGTAGATLTFASNAQPSSTTESLTGNGTPAPTHSVNLSWAASSSANISGYNIYRTQYSTSCGTFKKLNPQVNSGTLYTDSTVADGASYCYAVTTVNSSNDESGYSNIVSNIQIPAP
ncbi:MAG: choice-of-anchor D domain-containing protein [Candidatus Sulfotelmatobacter sp.]